MTSESFVQWRVETNKGCGTVDEAPPSLIRGFGFEPKNEKILARECFSPHEALRSTNSNIVGLQCEHQKKKKWLSQVFELLNISEKINCEDASGSRIVVCLVKLIWHFC